MGRYKIIDSTTCQKVGRLRPRHECMYRTCTVMQTNLDFSSRSRHGQEAPGIGGIASRCLRPSAVRQIRRSRKSAPNGFLSFRCIVHEILARYRSNGACAGMIIPWAFRGRHGIRTLGGLCAGCADVFRQARTKAYIDVGRGRAYPRFSSTAGKSSTVPGERRTTCPTGATTPFVRFSRSAVEALSGNAR